MFPTIRQAFHWKYAGVVIAFAGGAALTAALSDKFGLAYVFLVICCVYSVGYWLASDTLQGKRPSGTLVLPDHTVHVPSMRNYNLWKLIPSCLIAIFFAICVCSVHRLQVARQLEQFEGWLYPASDPQPQCSTMFPLPDDAIALYLGNSRLVAGKSVLMWAALVPQDRRIATPILVVERSRGRVALDLDVRGKDGRIVARIERNHFVVNHNNILTQQRPDRSTLVVIDQEGTEVLNVRYLNTQAIHLLGTFYVVGQVDPVVIKETVQDMGGGRILFSGACNASHGWADDVSMSLSISGDGSGNHEYDSPGSMEHSLSPVRKWNESKREWELQFRHPQN
jgi:hypothetical protein